MKSLSHLPRRARRVKWFGSMTLTGLVGLLVFIQSCSTVEVNTGRCKAFKDPKYVASVRDTDGKEWKILVTPKVADLKCDKESTTGVIRFTALVTDGQGFAKPALAVSSDFVGASTNQAGGNGFERNPGNADSANYAPDDVATDSCGTAQFSIKFTCPGPRKSIGGMFYVTSGPLRSEEVKVTLEHTVQPETTVIGGAPANNNAGNLNSGAAKP